MTSKNLRLFAIIGALSYVMVVMVNTLITYSWLRAQPELIRGMVRVVGVSALTYGYWRGEKWSEKFFRWGSTVLAVLSSLVIFMLVSPQAFDGRPYPNFDFVITMLLPISLIVTAVFAWMAWRKGKSPVKVSSSQ